MSRKLAQEEELRGQFVATLTHDLRGPLSTVHLSAQHLFRFPEKAELRDVLLQRIVRGADRGRHDPEPVGRGPDRSGERSRSAWSRPTWPPSSPRLGGVRLAHGDRFTYHGPPSLPGHWSFADVRRLLENLCTNAVKYGSLQDPVVVRLERHDLWVQLDVWNALADGHPLSAVELAAAFEPFHRTRIAQASGEKGWGLGLTLVKGIAEAHGGTVHATAPRPKAPPSPSFCLWTPAPARSRGARTDGGAPARRDSEAAATSSACAITSPRRAFEPSACLRRYSR